MCHMPGAACALRVVFYHMAAPPAEGNYICQMHMFLLTALHARSGSHLHVCAGATHCAHQAHMSHKVGPLVM